MFDSSFHFVKKIILEQLRVMVEKAKSSIIKQENIHKLQTTKLNVLK